MRRVGPWIWANPDIQNPVLPATDAETVCNQLPLSLMTDGGISEATNAEKSILFQGRLDRQNFCLLSPKHCWWWKNLLCVKILFFFLSLFRYFFFAFYICLQHLLRSCGCCTVACACARGTTRDGSDGRQQLLKEVGLQRSDLIFTQGLRLRDHSDIPAWQSSSGLQDQPENTRQYTHNT